MSLPRGIRNNNPGNIDQRKPKRAGWQGAVPSAQLTDSRFEQFIAPEWGIRALAKTLLTYSRKHGLNTVRGIIDRWAPPVENNTEAYINQVAGKLGVSPCSPINVQDPKVMRVLVSAIIQHENGQQPYSDAQITDGLARADVV